MFSVSEYFDRIKEASLEILETMEPIDKTITLWWGFDGIQLSEDGTFKWVSRRKESVENVFYHPCQSIQRTLPYAMPFESGRFGYSFTDQTQSTRAQIDALMAQCTVSQVQLWQNSQMANALRQCCVQYTAQHPPYY